MENNWKHVVIVGQGLAGTVLAFSLLERGIGVTIVDDGHMSSSSMVAAGMWNPLSFKKLHQSWLASQLLPVADKIYPQLEILLNERFYHPQELVRIFPGQLAANEWDERSLHPELSDFILNGDDQQVVQEFAQPFGHGIIRGAGWLDIPLFLKSAREYFKRNNQLLEVKADKTFLDDQLRNEHNLIVVATGWKNSELGFFTWLPLIPNKGEVLTLEISNFELNRMVNFGRFLIPLGKNLFRCGATYARDQSHIDPTDEAREEILADYQKFLKRPYIVRAQKAGYRPTVPDRKPLIGFHPDLRNLAVFNGFGSKGVMLIPYFAEHFTGHLWNEHALMPEINIERYAAKRKEAQQ